MGTLRPGRLRRSDRMSCISHELQPSITWVMYLLADGISGQVACEDVAPRAFWPITRRIGGEEVVGSRSLGMTNVYRLLVW